MVDQLSVQQLGQPQTMKMYTVGLYITDFHRSVIHVLFYFI